MIKIKKNSALRLKNENRFFDGPKIEKNIIILNLFGQLQGFIKILFFLEKKCIHLWSYLKTI